MSTATGAWPSVGSRADSLCSTAPGTGGVLSFGETEAAVSIAITNRDERCAMVNFDPDSAGQAAEVLKAIVRERDNKAGVYGTVTRRGRLSVGQTVFFEPAGEHREHP